MRLENSRVNVAAELDYHILQLTILLAFSRSLGSLATFSGFSCGQT
jgi:hypothetical protein